MKDKEKTEEQIVQELEETKENHGELKESVRSERNLSRNHQEFVSLFQNIPEALAYLDKDGNILNINFRFTELFGYTLEEIQNKNIDCGIIHPSGKTEEGRSLTKKSYNGYLNYESIRKKKDGTLFPVSISGTSIVVDGKVECVISLYKDITERKKEEKINKVLYNISQTTSSDISLKKLYGFIHKELGIIIDATNFYIALVDYKKNMLTFPYYIDEKDSNFSPEKFSTCKNLTCYVIKSKKPLLVNYKQIMEMNAQEKIKIESSLNKDSHWLGVPLKIGNRTIGAMAVQSFTNSHLYTQEDVKLMQFVSQQIAIALERKQNQEKLIHNSLYDYLTGLPNRLLFYDRFNMKIVSAKRNNQRIAVMFLDLDNFKKVNDSYGHDIGDKLLKGIAKRLKKLIRETDDICRLGGDEFVILFAEITRIEDISKIANKILRSVEKPFQFGELKIIISTSIGIAIYPQDGKDIEILIKCADTAMYQAKKRGKNSFQFSNKK